MKTIILCTLVPALFISHALHSQIVKVDIAGVIDATHFLDPSGTFAIGGDYTLSFEYDSTAVADSVSGGTANFNNLVQNVVFEYENTFTGTLNGMDVDQLNGSFDRFRASTIQAAPGFADTNGGTFNRMLIQLRDNSATLFAGNANAASLLTSMETTDFTINSALTSFVYLKWGGGNGSSDFFDGTTQLRGKIDSVSSVLVPEASHMGIMIAAIMGAFTLYRRFRANS